MSFMKNVKLKPRTIIYVPIEKVEIHQSSIRNLRSLQNQEYIKLLVERHREGHHIDPLEGYGNTEDGYTIIDGVLRLEMYRCLNFNTVPFIVTENEPKSVRDYLDLVFVRNHRSEYSVEEKIEFTKNLCRIDGEGKSSMSKEQINIIISNMFGKGMKRNNAISVRKVFEFDHKNPNDLNLASRLLTNQISVDVAKKTLEIFDAKYKYSLDDEKKSGLVKKMLDGQMNVDQLQSMLIKKQIPTDMSKIIFNKNYNDNNYEVFFGDSRQVKFKEGTILNGAYSSIPYYQQIKGYSKTQEMSKYEIGHESTPEEFAKNIASVYKNSYDYFSDDAVIGINISDTYSKGISLGIYYRIGMEMINAGFYPIGQTIWYKKDAKPVNEKMRRNRDNYEMVLMFSKSPNYHFSKFKFENPNKKKEIKGNCSEQTNKGKKGFHVSNDYDTIDNFMEVQKFSNIIELNQSTGRSKMEFHGDFSFLLPISFILQYIPENGIVWDPFGGTGTVGRSALLLNRKVIISELYEHNHESILNNIQMGLENYDKERFSELDENYAEETQFLTAG